MGTESKNLRDLLAGVITTGGTINVETSTATDLIRAVISSDGTTLKVSGISGTGGTGGSGTSGINGTSGVSGSFTGGTIGDVNFSGTISVHSSAGTSGWFPIGSEGYGVSLAEGIVTYMSFPTLSTGLVTENIGESITGVTGMFYRVTGGTDVEVTLPSSGGLSETLVVKHFGTSGTATISVTYPDTIDGVTFKTLNQYDTYTLKDGESGKWDII